MAESAQTTAGGNQLLGAAGGDQSSNTKAPVAGSAGSGGAKSRKPKGSNVKSVYGERTVKQYPIQERELDDLFRIGVIATGSFAGASWMFSICIDVFINLSLATGLPDSTISIWHTISFVSGILFVILLIAGGVSIYIGNNRIKEIKRETNFGEQ